MKHISLIILALLFVSCTSKFGQKSQNKSDDNTSPPEDIDPPEVIEEPQDPVEDKTPAEISAPSIDKVDAAVGSATVHFTAKAGVSLKLFYDEQKGVSTSATSIDVDQSPVLVQGLTAGTVYYFKMQASADGVTSEFSNEMFAMVRGASGSLDATFGAGGRAILAMEAPYSYWYNDLEVDSKGRIIIAGTQNESGVDQHILAMRLLPDGERDSTFGTNGKATANLITGTSGEGSTDIAVLEGDALLMTGYLVADFGAVRFDEDGTLSSGFGASGKLVDDFDGDTQRSDHLLAFDDGSFILGGYRSLTGVNRNTLVKYDASGAKIASFGASGHAELALPGAATSGAMRSMQQSDGKIIVASYYDLNDIVAVRFNSDGSLDTN